MMIVSKDAKNPQCRLYYEDDFAPGEKRELRAARVDVLNEHGRWVDGGGGNKILLFRGTDLVAMNKIGDFWIADVLAYRARGGDATISQLSSMVVREGGLPAATFLATLHGGFMFDTCAPGDFALVVENRGDKVVKFAAMVVGKCVLR